jgi:Holliday junction resolvase-like predicted endonuclease
MEVGFRHSDKYGDPAESIDYHKHGKMLKSAIACLTSRQEYNIFPVRFDAVAVTQPNYRLKIS